MQEGRMLVAGGLYDQPAGRWFSANYAGYIWQFLEKIGAKEFRFGDLKPDEHELYNEVREIRRKACLT